ncbi:DNA internalization-related competence protein ComEC/Rec2 [Salinicoccus halitifaciens]|uniref:Competence protein ComEC n=1 Tax=Salinicoccus halitifaciens TaxID=1073415 RepID=A0ABV2E6P8_9STAP|nr:DNA internalization-related competence protein ComEC/Rec2 [Salinicoccus halitifaciens]
MLGLFFLVILSISCARRLGRRQILWFLPVVLLPTSFLNGGGQEAPPAVIEEITIIDYKYYRDEVHYVVSSGGETYELFTENPVLESIGTHCTGRFDIAAVREQRNFLKQDDALRLTVNDLKGRIYLETLEGERCIEQDKDFGMWLAQLRNLYMQKVLDYTDHSYKFDLLTLTVGNKSYIENDFFDSLQKLGIYHLYVISGTHVAFITAVLYFAFRKMRMTSRTVKVLLILSLVMFYMLNIFSPSVFRSVFMAVMLILTSFFRKKPYLTVISLTALIQVAFNPYIVFHAGFQLSYITTYFILLSRPFLHGNTPIVQLIQITLIAEVSTLLVILLQFNEISISGIVMNMMFVPLFSMVVFPMVILFQFLLLLPYVPAVDYLYNMVFSVLQEVIYFLANIIRHRFSIKNLIDPVYIAIAGLSYMMAVNICRLKFLKACLQGGIFMTVIFAANALDRDDFTFTMIDVGQGDAFLIEDHMSGAAVLIDTGGEFTFGERESMLAERTVLPYLKERGIDDIDLLILSHMDIDHVGEVGDVLDKKNVRNLLVNIDDPKYEEWSEDYIHGMYNGNILRSEDVRDITAGHIHIENLTLENDYRPADSNDTSIVLKVTLGHYDFLMTGDVTEAMERRLAEAHGSLEADILKLAHHGSDTSSSAEFLELVKPDHVLISAGAGNQYGHPHKEVLERVAHTNILNTAEAGMVQLNIRGESLCFTSRLDESLDGCIKKRAE